jgi:hypothetical protein
MANVPQFPVDVKVFNATFEHQPGYAYRDTQDACWFVEEDGARWLLHDVDRPALTLNGRVDLVQAQAQVDGPGYSWVIRRNTEHARARMAA